MIYETLKFIKQKILKPLLNILQYRFLNKNQFELYKKNYETLRNLVDITTLKRATGEIRQEQLKNLEFSKEIINKLEINNIDIFLFAGSLLGAERHKGFIPWDDDIDFACFREDYNKILDFSKRNYKIFYHNVNKYNPVNTTKKSINKYLKENPNEVIVVLFPFIKFIKGVSSDNCVQFDIFPLYYYSDSYLYKNHLSYCDGLKSKIWSINNIKKEIDLINYEIKNNPNIVLKSNTISYGLDNPGSYIKSQRTDWWTHDDFFPLKKIKFEDTEFYAPNNHIKILDYWCKNWRDFPNDLTPPHAAERKA